MAFHALEGRIKMVEKRNYLPQTKMDQKQGPIATIHTNYGDAIRLFLIEAPPKTVTNFHLSTKRWLLQRVIFHTASVKIS